MKKVLLVLISCILLVGCGKKESDVVADVETTINGLNNYHLVGDLTIANNEDKYDYTVDVTYLKGDYYRVSLVNKANSHEQIILKNEEGVYVVTPSLNKSFKFQSEWPTNSSQSYILETILKDITDDQERNIVSKDDTFEITSKVNYPNNTDLKTQVVTIGKDNLPKKVVVKNSKGLDSITMVIKSIDTKTKYEKKYFALASNVKENIASDTNTTGETKTTSKVEDIVYPMYLPSGTKYSGEEVVTTSGSERVILTYTGVKPFILIEENAKSSKAHETTAVSGEVVQYGNVLGVMTETSLNWNENGREYYLIGDSLSKEELLQIASSTATVAVTK